MWQGKGYCGLINICVWDVTFLTIPESPLGESKVASRKSKGIRPTCNGRSGARLEIVQLCAMSDDETLSAHERLEAWTRAIDLVVEAYGVARLLPDNERYALTSQMRRAAVSIPANIAEGSARGGPRERMRYLNIARGELAELRTHFTIAERLGYVDTAALKPTRRLSTRVFQLINGLRRYVGRKAGRATPTS